jgi:hypothetical protein
MRRCIEEVSRSACVSSASDCSSRFFSIFSIGSQTGGSRVGRRRSRLISRRASRDCRYRGCTLSRERGHEDVPLYRVYHNGSRLYTRHKLFFGLVIDKSTVSKTHGYLNLLDLVTSNHLSVHHAIVNNRGRFWFAIPTWRQF